MAAQFIGFIDDLERATKFLGLELIEMAYLTKELQTYVHFIQKCEMQLSTNSIFIRSFTNIQG